MKLGLFGLSRKLVYLRDDVIPADCFISEHFADNG